jgi:hypothetical protein
MEIIVMVTDVPPLAEVSVEMDDWTPPNNATMVCLTQTPSAMLAEPTVCSQAAVTTWSITVRSVTPVQRTPILHPMLADTTAEWPDAVTTLLMLSLEKNVTVALAAILTAESFAEMVLWTSVNSVTTVY